MSDPAGTTATAAAVQVPAGALAPEGPVGRSTGWWGLVLFIATEAVTFAALLASYFYIRFANASVWPPPADKLPGLVYPSIMTGLLVASVVPMALASRASRRDRTGAGWPAVVVVFLVGWAFLVLQVLDWLAEWPSSTLSKDAYGSLFYSITGLHAAHVAIGVGMLGFLLVAMAVGRLRREHGEPVRLVALYWYFMAVLAVAVYLTVYLTPYL